MITTIKRALVRTAAAVCFTASFAANAAGVFYQSDFDPLGFAGSAVWRVDPSCNIASLDGYYGVNYLSGAPGGLSTPGCNVKLWSLTVQLWSGGQADIAAAIAAGPAAHLVQVTFDNEQLSSNPGLVGGIYVDNGVLGGVDTFLIGPEFFDNGIATGPTSIRNNYGVQFTSGQSPLGYLAPYLGGISAAIGNLPTAGAYLWVQKNTPVLTYLELCPNVLWYLYSCSKEAPVTDASGVESNGFADFTFGQGSDAFRDVTSRYDGDGNLIPEPGSLALLGSALVAGWITRRRKTAA